MAEVKQIPVSVGVDPEVFVRKADTKENVPICGLVGGTKEQPAPFADMKPHYAYQEDGAAFEFNIPAANSYDQVLDRLFRVWTASRSLLKGRGLEPVVKPFVEFKEKHLQDPRVRTIGCSPDMNAYGESDAGEQRKPLNINDFGNMRFAGGHIHLGYDKTKVPPHAMARLLDVMIGLPSTRFDKQGVRRQYYGLPGLYREKPYGIEYRSLSNFWVGWIGGPENRHYNKLAYLFAGVFDLGITANTNPQILAEAYKRIPWQDVKDSIETENQKLAREVWNYVESSSKIPSRYGGALWNEEV